MSSPWFIPFLCFVAAGLVIGVRMWTGARRSGGTAEMAFAAFALCLAMGVCTVMLAVAAQGEFNRGMTRGLSILGSLLVIAAIVILYIGGWRFYRPTSRMAQLFALAGTGITLAMGFEILRLGLLVDPGDGSGPMTTALLSLLGGLVWWGIESFLYHEKLKRRVRLGLSDPLVAERFRMNGFCSCSLAMIVGITISSPLLLNHPGRDDPILGPMMLALWAVVVASGSCAWLSPRPYRSLIAHHYARRKPRY